jgi:adenylate cyclase
MARLVELCVIGMNITILIAAILVGVNVSIWLGIVLLIVTNLSVFYLIFNFDYWFVRQLTKIEPELLMHLCETGAIGRARRLMRKLPSNPRCKFCQVPFGGFGALLRIKPATKNPNFCRSCFEGLPISSKVMDVGILFADIRGYTSWTENHSPSEAAEALAKFYSLANDILTSNDAIVELVGDQVMAIYVPLLPSLAGRTPQVMVTAAKCLVDAIHEDDDALPVGVGLNYGPCQVGNVKKGASKDFTAVGDAVNTAARLQSNAVNYQIVISESVYAVVADDVTNARAKVFSVKGKYEPLTAYVIDYTD